MKFDETPVITIDGPSGTGKGTVSQLLARELGWNFLDSGALYRVLAWGARQHAVSLENEPALKVLAEHLDAQFKVSNLDPPSVMLEGTDVTQAIRSESCGNDASIIAAFPSVRYALLARQRAFCEPPGLVTDGRDMGTVVFPNALLKIFLEATDETRIHRRFLQLKTQGLRVNLKSIEKELKVRDQRDKEREIAPLKPAEDAILVDTTGLTIEQVLSNILKLARICLEKHDRHIRA